MKRVFGLIDPAVDRIIYVGEIQEKKKYTAQRWVNHLTWANMKNDPSGKSAMAAYFQSGRKLTAVVLEESADAGAKARWQQLLLQSGHPVVNSMGQPITG